MFKVSKVFPLLWILYVCVCTYCICNGHYHSYPECTVGKVTPFFFFTREENSRGKPPASLKSEKETRVWGLKKQVFLVKGDFSDPLEFFWGQAGLQWRRFRNSFSTFIGIPKVWEGSGTYIGRSSVQMVNTGSHVAIEQSCGGKGRESNKEEEEDFGLPHGWLGGAFTLRWDCRIQQRKRKLKFWKWLPCG